MNSESPSHTPVPPVTGWMDVQLPLTPYGLEEPAPVSYVVNRDGRQERFDIQKIENSIRFALQVVGNRDRDLPLSLASSVAVYLNRHQVRSKPQIDRVRSAVDRVLRAMGQERAAAAYEHHRPGKKKGSGSTPHTSQAKSTLPDEFSDAPGIVSELLTGPGNPEMNTMRLAEKVKAVHALEKVYPRDVAKCHLEGLLDLPNVSRFDSLSRVSLFPERLKMAGVETGAPEWRASGSARKIDEVLGQLAGQTEILFRYISNAVHWEAVNLTLAPYVLEYDEATLRDVARVLLMEFAFRCTEHPERYGQVELGLVWNTPAGLTAAQAIGPGGIYTGQEYGYYEDTARRFALAIVAVHRELTEQESIANLPEITVTLPYDMSAPWEAVCGVESAGLSLRLEEQGLWLPFEPDALTAQVCNAHRVALNLHHVGLEATCEDDALAEMDRLMEMAARAHRCMAKYFTTIFDKGEMGSMGLLGKPYRNSSMVNPDSATYWVETTGLLAGVQALLQDAPDAVDSEDEIIARWLVRLQEGCAYWSEAFGLSIQLAPTLEEEVCEQGNGAEGISSQQAHIARPYGSHGSTELVWETDDITQRINAVRELLTHMPEGKVRLMGTRV